MASRRKRNRNSRIPREDRRFTVRGVRRDPPDIRKLSRALIDLAIAEGERQAQAEQATRQAQPEHTSNEHEHPGGDGDA